MNGGTPIAAMDGTREVVLPGACVVCGADLAVRIEAGAAGCCCLSCGWISRSRVAMEDGAIRVVHPTLLA